MHPTLSFAAFAGLAVLITASSPMSRAEEAAAIPRFEDVRCWFDTSPFNEVRCGRLTVLENRASPHGRTIEIAVVMIAPDQEGNDAGHPLVHLTGGPGYPTGLDEEGMKQWAATRREVRWLRDRPFILIDYRGTGRSSPLPACPEILWADTWNFLEQADAATQSAGWRKAAAQCRARLDEQGVDTRAYDSAADAADLVDLRRALGIAQWDVWSVSYGTQVAFALLRSDEAGIGRIILDSAVPPDAPLYSGLAQNFETVMLRMRDDCLADAQCADRFGDPLGSLTEVAERIEQTPLALGRRTDSDGSVHDAYVTKSMFLRTVFINLLDANDLVWLPLMIDQARNEDYWMLGQFVASFANGLQAEQENGSSVAVLLSHFCRDEFPFEAPEGLRHPPAEAPFDGFNPPLRELAICPDWAEPGDPALNRPVESAAPVLFLSGAYDPLTPTTWARAAMAGLPNARLVVFPGVAHGILPTDACGVAVAGAFLDDAGSVDAVSCVAVMQPPRFRLD